MAATRQLRAAGYSGPIVALTANVMQADVARYRVCGCGDVLAKPVGRVHFYRVLQRHVSQASTPDLGTDGAYARELAALTVEFLAGLPATLDAIDRALQGADWPALQVLALTLKGTAGSYGFAQIIDDAVATEAT